MDQHLVQIIIHNNIIIIIINILMLCNKQIKLGSLLNKYNIKI